MTTLETLLGPLAEIEPVLPPEIKYLSYSAANAFAKCPERFKRERLLKLPTPSSDKMLFGRAFGRAAEFLYRQKIESHEDLPEKEMRDVTGDSFNSVLQETLGEEEIVWHEFGNPAKTQTAVIVAMVGVDSAPGYLQVAAPTEQPVAVERKLEYVTAGGVPVVGYIDLETEENRVVDIKTTGRAKTQAELDKDLQAQIYLRAREAEGNPASGFQWHVVKRNKARPGLDMSLTLTPDAAAGADPVIDMTARLIRQYMDSFGLDEPWPPAPPMAWWCSRTGCSFYGNGCPWRAK